MRARQADILELLQQRQHMTIQELATHFGVSEMTIRRDTLALEERGILLRTYGGGVIFGQRSPSAPPITLSAGNPQKVAIGKLAAGLVAPRQTVMVDTGTTALEVARHLPVDAGITMATTSLPTAQEISRTHIDVLLLGGLVHGETQRLYGYLMEQMLQNLHVDLLFLGCGGADSTDGFYAYDLRFYPQLQAMMRCATKTIVVAESEKFQRKSLIRYAQLSEVHCVITDHNLSPRDRQNLEEHGVEVLLV